MCKRVVRGWRIVDERAVGDANQHRSGRRGRARNDRRIIGDGQHESIDSLIVPERVIESSAAEEVRTEPCGLLHVVVDEPNERVAAVAAEHAEVVRVASEHDEIVAVVGVEGVGSSVGAVAEIDGGSIEIAHEDPVAPGSGVDGRGRDVERAIGVGIATGHHEVVVPD